MEESRLPAERELEQILGLEEEEAKYEEPAGMGCDCRNLNSIFLKAIEENIPRWNRPGSEEEHTARASLAALAKGCGYERDAQGHWTQWPKQDAILGKLGPFTVIKEHDDGDLTLDTADGKVVVTTEGEVFYEKKAL